jgi:methylated-DNA-[protein]-cysteine S-methyltransferase
MTAFTRRVLTVVRSIPPGRVATYGDVAGMAGRPRAARAVGTVMRDYGDASIPCHRVIAAGGALGGYGGNEHLKRQLLVAEGVTVVGRRVRQFARVRWVGRARPRRRTPGRP